MGHLLLSILLAVPYLGSSNYWTQLSDTAVTKTPIIKSEVAQGGNNLYAVWMEEPVDDMRAIRFRRSGDNGLTWDDAVLIDRQSRYCNSARNMQMMKADGNNVYLLSQTLETSLYLFRSADGGQTFQRVVVDSLPEGQRGGGDYAKYNAYFIEAQGQDVVVAYQRTRNLGGTKIFVAISHDAGVTFQDTLINKDLDGSILYGLTYDKGRWSVLHHDYSWYGGLTWGIVYVTSGHELEFQTTKASPVTDSGKDKADMSTIGTSNYHPVMCQIGDTIHIVMDAQVVDSVRRKTVYRRSDDGGVTWTDPIILPGQSENSNLKQVIARNGHVYVVDVNESSRVGIHVSHDNGATWEHHNEFTAENSRQYWNGTEDYSLQFDPNDPSGLSVYFVAVRMMWLYTRDGFRTISAANSLGFGIMDVNGSNTIGHVVVDNQGKRHFFVRTKSYGNANIFFYHAEDRQPQPSGEMALHMAKNKSGCTESISITPKEDLRIDSAITVSLWVKVDSIESSNTYLAWHNVYATQEPSTFRCGWFMKLCYDKYDKKSYFSVGLTTDKSDDNWGTEINNKDLRITACGKWRHVLFTYDARMGGNNFRAYTDGILVAEASMTGKLDWGFTPILLGLDYYAQASVNYDDFCIWNCALTPEEVAQLPFKTPRIDNRVVYLDFNNTLADASGHGHGAVPLFGEEYIPHEPTTPPHADFNAIIEGKRLSAIDKTPDGAAIRWHFGDGYTSTQRHPQHDYYKVGDYAVKMIAESDSAAWGCEKVVSVAGLSDISPRGVGNSGYYFPTIYGGGLTKDISKIFLAKDSVLIPCDSLLSYENGKMKVRFTVEQAAVGSWNLIVDKDTLYSAVYISEAEDRWSPEITLTGREKLLKDKWQTYTFTIRNRNNTSMHQVPFYLFVQDVKDLDVEFINFKMGEPIIKEMPTEYQNHLRDSIGEYGMCKIKTPNLKDSVPARLYFLILPILEANSSEEFRVRIKGNGDIYVLGGVSAPLLAPQGAYRIHYEEWLGGSGMTHAATAPARYIRRVAMNDMTTKAGCLMEYIGRGVISGTAGAIPGGDCLVGMGFTVYDFYNDVKDDNKKIVSNALWNFGGSAIGCAASLMGPLTGFLVGTVSSMICNYHTVKECLGDPNTTEKNVRSVTSLDPNEMVGPAGAGDEHWLKHNQDMDYTIFFENKSTATAPAHTIAIRDTLDTTTLDFSSFGFTHFAWGDTTFTIEGTNVQEFTRDVDLRPAKELIVRVSGKLDTVKGIADWTILSLNPITREEEEDPDLGVLPPNDEKGSGEGYVGYRIAQKGSLASGTSIHSKATIVFDTNDPIATNDFVNRIDTVAPSSTVASVEAVGDSLLLTFSGTDTESGIATYEVWGQFNDTITGVLDAAYSGNTMKLPIVADKMGFWIVATDKVGWQETKERAPEVVYEKPTDLVVPTSDQRYRYVFKVFDNNQIYILRDNQAYTITGQKVR